MSFVPAHAWRMVTQTPGDAYPPGVHIERLCQWEKHTKLCVLLAALGHCRVCQKRSTKGAYCRRCRAKAERGDRRVAKVVQQMRGNVC
jgi:hypothetical protein